MNAAAVKTTMDMEATVTLFWLPLMHALLLLQLPPESKRAPLRPRLRSLGLVCNPIQRSRATRSAATGSTLPTSKATSSLWCMMVLAIHKLGVPSIRGSQQATATTTKSKQSISTAQEHDRRPWQPARACDLLGSPHPNEWLVHQPQLAMLSMLANQRLLSPGLSLLRLVDVQSRDMLCSGMTQICQTQQPAARLGPKSRHHQTALPSGRSPSSSRQRLQVLLQDL